MALRAIKPEGVTVLLESLMKETRVVAPHRREGEENWAFEEVRDPGKICLEYTSTIIPPKKYVFPPKETLVKYTLGDSPSAEAVIEAEPLVLFGVHPCDIYGINAPRFATQPLASAFSLAIFIILLWITRRRWSFDSVQGRPFDSTQDKPFPGLVFTLYLLLYAGGQFLLEFTRGDEAIYWGPWRISQWIYLAEAAFALVFLARLRQKFKSSLTKL